MRHSNSSSTASSGNITSSCSNTNHLIKRWSKKTQALKHEKNALFKLMLVTSSLRFFWLSHVDDSLRFMVFRCNFITACMDFFYTIYSSCSMCIENCGSHHVTLLRFFQLSIFSFLLF